MLNSCKAILARLYGIAVFLRVQAYETGFFKSEKLPVPVISVGNIIAGGSGKTPFTLMLTEKLLHMNAKPAILSRGYKGANTQAVGVVSDGKSLLMTSQEAGDEPYMMASRIPGVPVLVGKKRIYTGKYACNQLNCTVVVLDDGMQHLKIKRDLNIVLIHGRRSLQQEKLIPAGLLREPLTALKRAQLIVISHATDECNRNAIREYLATLTPSVPIVTGTHAPVDVISAHTKELFPKEYLKGKQIGAFCGIAHPNSFKELLESLGCILSTFQQFPDHYAYKPGELDLLWKQAQAANAEFLVTTEKDLARLTRTPADIPLLGARISFTITDGEPILNKILEDLILHNTRRIR